MANRVEFFLAAALLWSAAAGCASGDEAASAEAREDGDQRDRTTYVAVVAAQPRDLARVVTVTGPVEPVRTIVVATPAAGIVRRLLVQEGDRVRRGQLLAELDARETTAQLERARALLSSAEAAFRRSERLHEEGMITDAQREDARAAYDVARAEVELWSTRLDFSRIEAPSGGVVTAKRVEVGSAVTPNQPLFEIADDSLLVVRVRVSERDVVSLSSGDPVALSVDAYPDVELRGRIQRLFPAADADSRLVPVEVALGERPAGVEIRPGFLARVALSVDRREDVLAVPVEAVGVGGDGSFVYVVEEDTLERRPVATGATVAGWVEVTDGLRSGDWVVTSGHTNLRPGATVQISERTSNARETS